jgi:hypothetical protein
VSPSTSSLGQAAAVVDPEGRPVHKTAALREVARLHSEGTTRFAEVVQTRTVTQALGEFAKKLADGTDAVAAYGKAFLKAGSLAAGTALQSASPDAFATLSGGFQLILARFGQTLIP